MESSFDTVSAGQAAALPWGPPTDQPSVDVGSWLAWALVIVGGCAAFAVFRVTHSPEATVIVGACFFVPGIAMSPMVGLCLIVLSVPLEGLGQLVTGWVTFTRAIGLLVAAVFLPRMLGRSFRQMFYSRTALLYYLPALWLLLTFPFALQPLGAWIEMSTHLSILGLVFLVAAVPRDIRQLRMLCLTAIFGAAVLAVYVAFNGTGAFATRTIGSVDKFAGETEHGLGQQFALGLLLSAIVWRDAGKLFRVAILVMDSLLVFGIGLSNSRTTWAALLAAAFLTPLITRRISAKYRMIFIACAVLVGLTGFLLVFGDVFGDTGKLVRYRMMTMFDPTAGGPGSSGRFDFVWPHYWEFIRAHFLIGGGWGSFYYIGFASHNDLLGAMAYGGAVGGMLYLGYLFAAFREAGRNVDPWFRLVTVALCVMLTVAGVFMHGNISKQYAISVGVLACMANLGFCPRRKAAAQQASLLAYPT